MTIGIIWALAMVAGVMVGLHKNRLGMALLLTFFLSWLGVIILAFIQPPGPRKVSAPRAPRSTTLPPTSVMSPPGRKDA